MPDKRVLVIADLHGGHAYGCTHPEFERKPPSQLDHPQYQWRKEAYQTRRRIYDFLRENAEALKPDILFVVGDAVEGKGIRNKRSEILFGDRGEQASNAAAIINDIGAKKVVMVYGTPYHTGVGEDWENEVAKEVKNLEKLSASEEVDVNGVLFNIKHYIGRSSIPHGRYTALAKENMWNIFWAERREYARCHVFLRAHTHYFAHCGDDEFLGVICPSLCGKTRYGVERKGDVVHTGIIWFDVSSKGEYDWHWRILKIYKRSASVVKL